MPGKFHGQRSLAGYKMSDMTDRFSKFKKKKKKKKKQASKFEFHIIFFSVHTLHVIFSKYVYNSFVYLDFKCMFASCILFGNPNFRAL